MQKRSNAKKIGDTIYQARERKGISSPELANRIGVHRSYLAKLQLGEVQQPRPALLTRIAEELDLNAGELFALAGYVASDEMPDLRGFLNVKYRELPDDAIDQLQGHLEYLVDKHSKDASDQTKRKEEP